MTDIWLPPGARRYDDAVEEVLADSPPEARALADELSEQGVRFVAKDDVGATIGPDDGVVLLPSEWADFDHPDRGKLPIVCVESAELERMVLDATLDVEVSGVVDGADHPAVASFGPSLYFRLREFHVYIPLGGAPAGWLDRARDKGFAVTFPEDGSGQRAWFATGPMKHLPGGLVLPGTSRGAKVGRNDRCPCGSRIKFKRCHGR